jgi:hypothetical protein
VGSELRTLMHRAATIPTPSTTDADTSGSIIGLNLDDYCIEARHTLTTAQINRAHREGAGLDGDTGLWPILIVLWAPPPPSGVLGGNAPYPYPAPPDCITDPRYYLQATALHQESGTARVDLLQSRPV